MSSPGGAVVWITGLPAAGKSTLAERAQAALRRGRTSPVILDSDGMRPILGPELGYAPAERDEFYRRLAALAVLLADQGCTVLVAATAPERHHRDTARGGAPRFIEVFVDTPLAECERRDVKGLYRRAAEGAAPTLPGAGAGYEPPARPDLVAHGGHDRAALEQLVSLLGAG